MSDATLEPHDLHEPRADWLAYGMVGCVLFALSRTASGQLAVQLPLYGLLAGLVLTRGRKRFSLNWVSVSLLVLPLLLLLNLIEVKGRGGNQFLRSFYLAYGMVELALLQLYAQPTPAARGRVIYLTAAALLFVSVGLPDYIGSLPGWKESAPVGSLVGSTGSSPHVFYLSILTVWGLLALAAFVPRPAQAGAPGARGRSAAWLLCAALALGCSGGGIFAFRVYYTELSEIYYRLVGDVAGGAGGGFSDRGELGSITDLQGKDGGREIALRAVSETPPGYLRGRAFVSYTQGAWRPGAEGVQPLPESGRVRRPDTAPLEDGDPEIWVYPESAHQAVVFAPLRTGELRLSGDGVKVLPGWCLRPYDLDTSNGVPIRTSREPWHTDGELAVYRELPAEDPALLAALDTVWERVGLGPNATYGARVAALKAYFDRAYTYKFGITFSGTQDPLTEFLLEKDHGHCELFASAGALLLRRVGIPARYTTGFLCLERSPVRDQLWVARNRSAHAWIEAYHPQRGWEEIEFTPAGGMPQVDPPGTAAALLEALGGWFGEVAGALRGRLSELPGRLLAVLKGLAAWFTATPWRWGGTLILLALVVGWRLWRKRAPRVVKAAARTVAPLHPELQSKRERFVALEAQLTKAGLPRAAGETLLEFHARLTDAAWPLPTVDRTASLEFVLAFAVDRYRAYPETP